MEKRRGGELIVIIGYNNTGKSVETRFLIENFNNKRKGKSNRPKNFGKLIVYDPHRRYEDFLVDGDIVLRPSRENWYEEVRECKDSLMVLDDYRGLIPNDRMDSGFLDILFDRAEHGLDIIIITHSPLQILNRLVTYIDKYILFYSLGDEKAFEGKTTNPEVLVMLRDMVNKEYKKYSPEDYSKLYPNFPYIYYDTVRDKAIKVNFKE